MASDSRTWQLTKSFATTSILAITASQVSTSAFFIPALLRPLQGTTPPLPRAATPSPKPSSSSLGVPAVANDGRLTPQPSTEKISSFDLLSAASPYKAIASQFSTFNSLNFYVAVPLELLSIGVFGTSAYLARNGNRPLWIHWAASAGLVAAIFPFTGALMEPLVHKVMRIAGDEEKIEPYEDAPIDREAEKSNTVEFVTKWNYLNMGRAVVMGLASVWSTVALYHEYGPTYVLMV